MLPRLLRMANLARLASFNLDFRRLMIRTIVISSLVLAACSIPASAVTFDWATVGNAGNAPDPETGFGSVGYTYNISKHEVTNRQYMDFLNAVASVGDVHGLYNSGMSTTYGGIARNGTGTPRNPYVYSVKDGDPNWYDRPVNFVSWGDSARFCNWLHNGQPVGPQDLTTTEDGSYFLNGAMTNEALQSASRKSGATYFIPSEDEWYKSAYHKNDGPTGSYFDYPTSSDNVPSNLLVSPDPGNNANFFAGSFPIDPYGLTEVGEFENSASPYGLFDQGGNLWEWTEGVIRTLFRSVRGGSFDFNDREMRADIRFDEYPRLELFNSGFRVAHVPEPDTVLLAALASAASLVPRRCRGGRAVMVAKFLVARP